MVHSQTVPISLIDYSAYSCCALSVNTGMFMIHLMSEIVIGDEFVASLKPYCVSVKT